MSKYKMSFNLVGNTGQITIKLKNELSGKNASALFNHSLAILEANEAEKENNEESEDEEEKEDEDEEEEEEDWSNADEEPDLSTFEGKSLKDQYPNEDHLKLRIIHYNPERMEEVVEYLVDKLHLPPVQCYEMITNKEDTPLLSLDIADQVHKDLRSMGLGISIKKANDEKPLYEIEESPL